MKPFLFIFVLFFSGQIQAETLVQLRNRVDVWLTNRWPMVVSRQNAYLTNHGRYWQGLITHTSIPAHESTTSADSTGDKLTLRPTDQTETWLDIFPEWSSESLAAAVVMDVYSGPEGQGWIATVFVKFNGTIYKRTKATGPETWRDSVWSIFAPL